MRARTDVDNLVGIIICLTVSMLLFYINCGLLVR